MLVLNTHAHTHTRTIALPAKASHKEQREWVIISVSLPTKLNVQIQQAVCIKADGLRYKKCSIFLQMQTKERSWT